MGLVSAHWVLATAVLSACGASGAPASPVAAQTEGASCGGARLLRAPADLSARGPWAVGARTLEIDGAMVEVWYPARGAGSGAARVRYDLRTAMPPGDAAKIPDADNAWLDCACERDLAVDTSHGPYPVVLFFHGAASFRAQSAFLATHWASRGFVVVAPDLPGVGLAAILSNETRLPLEVPIAMLDLVAHAPSDADPLAFIRPQLGAGIAVVGHSLGSLLAEALVDRPEIAVKIAMAGTASFEPRVSTLVLAGEHDGIASAADARTSFATAPPASRLAIVRGAGHLAFTDLCLLGADRGGALAIARTHGVAIPEMIATLATDGCRTTDVPFGVTAPAIRAITVGVLEERLRCDPAATAALHQLGGDPQLELVEHLGR